MHQWNSNYLSWKLLYFHATFYSELSCQLPTSAESMSIRHMKLIYQFEVASRHFFSEKNKLERKLNYILRANKFSSELFTKNSYNYRTINSQFLRNKNISKLHIRSAFCTNDSHNCRDVRIPLRRFILTISTFLKKILPNYSKNCRPFFRN